MDRPISEREFIVLTNKRTGKDMSIHLALGRSQQNHPSHRSSIAVPSQQRISQQRVSGSKPRRPKAVRSASVAARLKQSDREVLLRKQALLRAQQGNYAEAIALFDQLISAYPGDAGLYNNRGLLLFQQGELAEALQDYDRALELNPQLTKVYNNRANCYVALGHLNAAILDYEAAIDLDPTNIRAWINQGITYRDLGNLGQAIETFDLAFQVLEMLQGAEATLAGHLHAERGRTHHQLGDWNWAVADYRRALATLPGSANGASVSHRLRLQVESWLNTLLNPLSA